MVPPLLLGIAGDTRESLRAHIAKAVDADIVTIGGASVGGDHDLAAVPVLSEAGMALDFWRIAMRPGLKPLMYGLAGNMCWACQAIGLVRVYPVVSHSAHSRPAGLPGRFVGAGSPAGCNPSGGQWGRAHYMRANRSTGADGVSQVTPVANQDSSLMQPLAAADCLLVRPINAPAEPAGAAVPILLLDF
ncbi:MAG: hypothetical protein R3D67_10965 [Hyphomicrobiaceae bacterium]